VIGHIAWRFDERRQAFLEEPALAKPTVVRPSPNLYLDATRVDLDDVGAIQVFISEHGALRIDPTIQVDLGLGLRSDLWNRRKGYFALASNMSGYHCELARSRRRAEKGLTRPNAIFGYEPLAHTQHGLFSIKHLLDCWRAMQGKATVEWKPAEAAEILALVLDDACAALAPRMAWIPQGEDAEDAFVRSSPPLFCVMALQLARRIAQRTPLRRCPGCDKEFEVHEGRGRGERRRGDAIYCSHYCSQRAARQRHREKTRRRPKS
jgi:hypothetical protein